MSAIEVDVAICTYNSEKYLGACLESIRKNIPYNRLVVVDHYSTDGTVEIANKYGAEIYFENVGLGYARQLAIECTSAPFLLFVDSDVVFYDGEWFKESVRIFKDEKKKAGAIGIDTPVHYPDWRQKYNEFWLKHAPKITKKKYFHNVYFLRRKAIEGIKIPSFLGAYEHIFIKKYVERKGWKIYIIDGNGIHYYDFPDWKGAWLGAGARLSREIDVRKLSYVLFRRVLTASIKALPPAIAYNDPSIIIHNSIYWFRYLKGWLEPKKYLILKRDASND